MAEINQYLDYTEPITAVFKSVEFNSTNISSLGSTKWIKLNYLEIKYSTTEDFFITVLFRNDRNPLNVQVIRYIVSKDQDYFKQRLPKNLICHSFVVMAEGSFTGYSEISEFGIDADPFRIGAH